MRRRFLLAGASAFALSAARADAQPVSTPGYAPSAVGIPPLGPLNSGLPSPLYAFDFTQGVFDPRLSFSSPGAGATYFNQAGTLVYTAANTPRVDYGPTPAGVTNWLNNSTMQGAVAGTPGTMPTGWNLTSAAGVSRQVIGTGVTADGIPYADLRVFGTATAAAALKFNLAFQSPTIPSAFQEIWTGSFWYQVLNDVSDVPVTGIIAEAVEFNGAGSYLNMATETGSTINTWHRLSGTTTLTQASNYGVGLSLWSSGAASVVGGYVDVTIRVGAPQMELASSVGAFVPTTTAPVTVGAIALGLLIEEARTNLIRNPRAEGAGMGGSPGGTPTNWVTNAATYAGITFGTVNLGTENGIPFIDFQMSGTPTSTTGLYVRFDSGATISGSAVYQLSMFAKLVGGSGAGLLSLRWDDSSSYAANGPAITPTSAPLGTQRFSAQFTSGSGATTVQPGIRVALVSGVPINVTFRIGAPQLELGGFATSVILPPAGTPAATARNLDLAFMSFAGFVAGSFAMQITATLETAIATYAGLMLMDDGSGNNRVLLRVAAPTGQVQAAYAVSGTGTAQPFTTVAPTPNVPFKAAAAYDVGSIRVTANNTTPVSQAGASPTGINTFRFGVNTVSAQATNGWISKAAIYNQALTNAQLQALTV